MKKLLLFLFAALIIFVGSFTISQRLPDWLANKSSENTAPFTPATYTLQNRPFTIIIVGYNNGAFVEKTLSSVFAQNYDNFRIVYIDDASNDGSFDVARDCIYESDHLAHVTLVRNEDHLGALANIYRAVSACLEDEIVVLLHGEDWLSHEWVLQRLNAYYDNPNLWITLAQGIDYPTFLFAPEPNVKGGRLKSRMGSHLTSFYAALFKKVREEDFIYAGSFLKGYTELAYMTPMLEMGEGHFYFIPEVLCVNNREAIREENREEALLSERFIRSLEPYAPLNTLQVISCGD